MYVLMEMSDWVLETSLSSMHRLVNTSRTTSSRMSWPGAEWRCVLEGVMGQCVMTSGTMRMLLSCAHNSDSLPLVSSISIFGRCY